MRVLRLIAALLPVLAAGCHESDPMTARQARVPGGRPGHGAALIAQFGCGTCHMIPGIADANGEVGPSLVDFGRRIYVAGMLRNTPDNLVTWLRDPQSVVPGNAMPDMRIDGADARDIAAYLYTLR